MLLISLSGRSRLILDEAAKMGMTSEGWAWLVTDGTTSSVCIIKICLFILGNKRTILCVI